jgi:hypothetical protein
MGTDGTPLGAMFVFGLTLGVEAVPGDEMPKEFTLAQNYPNPFNPATTIEFSVPKNEFVSLKLYDLLGKEVSTLVSENLNAGVYRKRFDAGQYASSSSGVYFYKLSAGSFVGVKKMLVIK